MRGVSVTDGGPLNSASKTLPMPCFSFRCLFTEHGSHYNSSLFCHESLVSRPQIRSSPLTRGRSRRLILGTLSYHKTASYCGNPSPYDPHWHRNPVTLSQKGFPYKYESLWVRDSLQFLFSGDLTGESPSRSVTVYTKHVHVMFDQQTVSSLQTLGALMRTSSQKKGVSQRTLL
jgi:hypothetical protein